MRWPWTRSQPDLKTDHTDPIPDYDRVFPPGHRPGYPIWSPLLGEWIEAPEPDALTEPTEQYPFVTPAQEKRGRGAQGA